MDGAVRSVWADNFNEESQVLRRVAPHARHVALNVQYPGCVVHGDGRNHHALTSEERYQVIRDNVTRLKPLQVGIAVSTVYGHRFTWEFNLREFNIASGEDERDQNSIDYLAGCGVDFDRLPSAGISAIRLRCLLRDSGLFGARLSWATFSGAYHVAYFVSIMSGEKLPDGVDDFMRAARELFGSSSSLYDVKLMAREHDRTCVGGLSNVVVRPYEGISKCNPAGTGSRLALLAFETLKQMLGANPQNYAHQLCGLQII